MTLEHWDDARLDRLAENVEKITTDVKTLTADVQALTADVQALRGDVQTVTTDLQALTAEVRSGFAETRANIAALTRLAELQQDNIEGTRQQFEATIARMDQIILELRAGQQRQDAILDYLIRRDGQQGAEPQE